MKRTNIVLDDRIVKECMNITGIKTKKDVIHYALNELIRRNDQKKLLELKGKIEWDGDLEQWRKGRYS